MVGERHLLCQRDAGVWTAGQWRAVALFGRRAATISGGQRLDLAWAMGANGVWSAKVPPDVVKFKQLFVDGVRAIRARSPNVGENFQFARSIQCPLPRLNVPADWANYTASRYGFVYGTGQMSNSLHNLKDVEVCVLASWTTSRHWIDSIDESNNTVAFTNPSLFPMGDNNWPGGTFGQLYYLDNVLEGLDSENEWYFDAASRILSYIPAEHGSPDNSVVIPTLFTIVDIRGASNLYFQGLDFQHSEWSCSGESENRTALCESIIGNTAQEIGSVQIFQSNSISFDSCSFQNLRNFALYVEDRSWNVTVSNCTFRDLISGGVRIGGGMLYNDRGPYNCTVRDNTILYVGTQMVLPSAAGIVVACTTDIWILQMRFRKLLLAESWLERNTFRSNH